MLRRLFLVFIILSTFAVMGCKIKGKITQNGVGLEGITVTLSGDASISTTTDTDGAFVFRKLKNGNYKVKPADAKFTFEPVSKDVTINDKKKIARADFKAITSQPPSTPSLDPWSTYQGDADHTGYRQVELNPDNFSFGWERKLIDSVPLNPVAAGDGKVFVTSGGNNGPHVAMALDSADGTTLWSYDFGDIFSVHPPAYANGTVYIQSGVNEDSFLRAFDAEPDAEGMAVVLSEIRYDNFSGRFYAPTVYDDNGKVGVYAGGGYLDESGGERGRTYGYSFDGFVLEESWFEDFLTFQSDQWTPAVNADRVIAYHGVFEGQLTVIKRLEGLVEFSIPDPNFKFDFESGASLDLAPVLGSQNNVIVIQGGRLINFDLEKQAIGWEMPEAVEEAEAEEEAEGFSGQPSLASPTSLAEGIIFAVYEGELQALNESDGSFVTDWKPWQPPDDKRIDAPMIVTDILIFVSTASKTYAVDLEKQKEEWSYPAGGQLALSEEGVLFIATADGILIAINTD